jgi:multidrug resistance efflux pump
LVSQPGKIEAFEQTALYAKVPGFVSKWNVDIGDKIAKDQVLCELWVPELVEQHKQKIAAVALDQVEVDVCRKRLAMAHAALQTATANIAQMRAGLKKAQADYERWQSESKRDADLVAKKVIDEQIADESRKQFAASDAAVEQAQASISAAVAAREESSANVAKSEADVQAALAKVRVDEADRNQVAALLTYTKITAPYDGVVVERTVNTGDFVQPATGDRGRPIYTVARTDVVRIFVSVPELEAPYIQKGSRAKVRIQALQNADVDGVVARTSWALNQTSRNLRVEVDMPNKDMRIQPNMYAYGSVLIDHPNVQAVPAGCVVELGNRHYAFEVVDGKAVRLPVRIGVSDGVWTEIIAKQTEPPKDPTSDGVWQKLSGKETLIDGSLDSISDGQHVAPTGAK